MDHTHLFFTMKHGTKSCRIYATLEDFLEEVPVSGWHPAPIRRIIEDCDFGDSTYILGPWYTPEAGNDFQMAVTGKPKLGESLVDGITRELGEEIGAIPSSPSSLTCCHTCGKWTGWSCSATNNMIGNIDTGPPPNPNEDDKSRGVCCVVHATEARVLQIFDSHTILWTSTDKIDGIVAIPIAAARSLVRRQEAKASPRGFPCSSVPPMDACDVKTMCTMPPDVTCKKIMLCDKEPDMLFTPQSNYTVSVPPTVPNTPATPAWGATPSPAIFQVSHLSTPPPEKLPEPELKLDQTPKDDNEGWIDAKKKKGRKGKKGKGN